MVSFKQVFLGWLNGWIKSGPHPLFLKDLVGRMVCLSPSRLPFVDTRMDQVRNEVPRGNQRGFPRQQSDAATEKLCQSWPK